jgi:hypothetical protein
LETFSYYSPRFHNFRRIKGEVTYKPLEILNR